LLTKIKDKNILDQIHKPESERLNSSFSDHLNKITSRFTARKTDPA